MYSKEKLIDFILKREKTIYYGIGLVVFIGIYIWGIIFLQAQILNIKEYRKQVGRLELKLELLNKKKQKLVKIKTEKQVKDKKNKITQFRIKRKKVDVKKKQKLVKKKVEKRVENKKDKIRKIGGKIKKVLEKVKHKLAEKKQKKMVKKDKSKRRNVDVKKKQKLVDNKKNKITQFGSKVKKVSRKKPIQTKTKKEMIKIISAENKKQLNKTDIFESIVITGKVIFNGKQKIFISDLKTQKNFYLAEGEFAGNMQVIGIYEDTAELKIKNKKKILKIISIK
jgi:hypothetical protein